MKRSSHLPRATHSVRDGCKSWIQVRLSLKPQCYSQVPRGSQRTPHTDIYCSLFLPLEEQTRLLPSFLGQSPQTPTLQGFLPLANSQFLPKQGETFSVLRSFPCCCPHPLPKSGSLLSAQKQLRLTRFQHSCSPGVICLLSMFPLQGSATHTIQQ